MVETFIYSLIPLLVPVAFIWWTCRIIGKVANKINPIICPELSLEEIEVAPESDNRAITDAVEIEWIGHASEYWEEQLALCTPNTPKYNKISTKIGSYKKKLAELQGQTGDIQER